MACAKNKKYESTHSFNYIPVINKLSNQGNWRDAIEIVKINLNSVDQIAEKEKIHLYLLLGKNYRFLEEYENAEENFKKVISHSKSNKNSAFIGQAYYGLGDLNYLKWSYFKKEETLDSSKEYLDSSMVYAKRNNNLQLLSKILYRQGTIFQIQGHEEESRKHFEKGLNISFSIADTIGIIRNNTHTAVGFKKSGVLDSALIYYQRAYEYAKAINRNYSEAHSLCNLGLYYLDKEEVSTAKNYFNRAAIISEELNHRIILCRSYYGLSVVEEKLGKHKEAIKYAINGLRLAKEKGYKNFESAFTNLIEDLNKH